MLKRVRRIFLVDFSPILFFEYFPFRVLTNRSLKVSDSWKTSTGDGERHTLFDFGVVLFSLGRCFFGLFFLLD